jgi:hypothetical protein
MLETKLYHVKNRLECARDALNFHDTPENWRVIAVLEDAIADIQEVINAAECRDLTKLG